MQTPPSSPAPQNLNTTDDLCKYLAKLKKVKVLKRVPRGARYVVADELAKTINVCLVKNETENWTRLLRFSYSVFRTPTRNVSLTNKVSLTTLIRRQLVEFSDSAVATFSLAYSHNPSSDLSKRVSAKLGDGDVRGAVRILSSTSTIATPDHEVISAMKEKHPDEPEDLVLPPCPDINDHSISFDESLVRKAITSFPAGSGAGPDGLRPQHLKDLISFSAAEAGERLLESITRLVNFMLAGRLPQLIASAFNSSSLIALKKKDGGLRPIAVGNAFRRLSSKLASQNLAAALGSHLRPTQLGCGTPGGCEAAVHAARKYITASSTLAEKRVLLKIDFKNAFNTLRRDHFLSEAKEFSPEIYNYLWQSYAHPSKLIIGDETINSSTGIQQGDPLGPALFCLGVQKLTKDLVSELNLWYLDDASLGGKPTTVYEDLEKIITGAKALGLEINTSKCELALLCHEHPADIDDTIIMFRQLVPNVRILTDGEFTLLGSPISQESIPPILENKITILEMFSERLQLLKAHDAIFLLKNCFAMPKLLYTVRTSPVWNHINLLKRFDDILILSLQRIANTCMSETSTIQATLPVAKGGLGIRKASDIALPAFLASVYSTMDLVSELLPNSPDINLNKEYNSALTEWCGRSEQQAPTDSAHSQRAWDEPLSLKAYTTLLNNAQDRETRARLLAVATQESGAWLNAIPSAPLGNFLDNDVLRISIAIRLGAPICVPHTCRCGSWVDESGRHGLSCRQNAGRLSRHHAINDIIKRSLVSAGAPAVLEPPGTSRDDGKRPDGMTLIPWEAGRSLVWDVTCVDSFAASNIGSCYDKAGGAAEVAEGRKRDKYSGLGGQFHFVPIGVETLGSWGPDAVSLIHSIGRRVIEATGEKHAMGFLRQRISIAIQRGNASSVLATFPPSRALDELFIYRAPTLPVLF